MTDPITRLFELTSRCVVRLGYDVSGSPDDGGSGFWIAPGLLLTCAHVVPAGNNSTVQVGWNGRTLTGEISEHTPDTGGGSVWAYPDLAVVSVHDAPPHPCAWICERRPLPGAGLMAFGHSAQLGKGLQPGNVAVWFTGAQEYGDGEYWQVKGNELTAGMSGGPVVDPATGAVCALVTATIGEGADRGGFVVPVRGLASFGAAPRQSFLAAHDRFHSSTEQWTVVRGDLEPPPFAGLPIEPADEVALLGLLADLPPAAGSARDPRAAVYRLFEEHGAGGGWIRALLELLHALTGSPHRSGSAALHEWTTAFARRIDSLDELHDIRHARAVPTHVTGGIVSIEIVPGMSRRDRFNVSVYIEHDHQKRKRLGQHGGQTLTLGEAEELVNLYLQVALEELEGDAFVEFAIPIHLLDTHLDELSPISRFQNIGRQFPVVLRLHDRQRHRSGRSAWVKRWQNLLEHDGSVHWVECTDDVDPSDLLADLDEHDDAGLLALTRRPLSNTETLDLLRAALDDAGMPAVVWRRDTCAEHDAGTTNGNCTGRSYRASIDPILRRAPINKLPERVRQLRTRAARRGASDDDLRCRGTVLLWDDPHRPAPPPPLREGPLSTVGGMR